MREKKNLCKLVRISSSKNLNILPIKNDTYISIINKMEIKINSRSSLFVRFKKKVFFLILNILLPILMNFEHKNYLNLNIIIKCLNL